jgi:hypothetical protein
LIAFSLHQKHLHRWIFGYGRHWLRTRALRKTDGVRHVLFAVCDHFEPLWGQADDSTGARRIARWERGYSELARSFRDADGNPPRHTFFFPGEQYRPEYLEALARLARSGFGEVELHLHHDADDASKLSSDIHMYTSAYASHGHLPRGERGQVRYGFIHGNWCLANSRNDGRYCGVDSELRVLFETGCYADFTFPSAPDETQPGIVNQIYWPTGDLSRARSHERGMRARVGVKLDGRILMIQGPLALSWRAGRRRIRIDSAALTANDPGTSDRVDTWVSQHIHVDGAPDWIFVKVHTHGAPEPQGAALLGESGRAMHRALAARYNDGKRFALHYVTAREMFNVALSAIDGCRGDPNQYRDYLLPPPPIAS